MPAALKQRRTRVIKKDIEVARKQLAVQPKPRKLKKVKVDGLRHKKDFWYGLVYCDFYGYAWTADFETSGEMRPISLVSISKFISYLKRRGIDGEDVLEVLMAFRELRTVGGGQDY